MEVALTLLRYILLYFIIISGSMFIADKAKKKIEKCIAPNIAIIILVLYIFGILEILKYGVWAISIVNILLGLYTIIKNWRNKEELKTKIMTAGLGFFTIVFFILMLTTYNKNLVDYDHYFYRSLNTKIMYYTDTISRGFEALYPPASNLLQYFFMKIIGAYIQGVEAFAMQMFGFALLLPLFDRVKNTRFMNIIISIVIICMPAILNNLIFYKAAYPDALLGLIIGYSMYILCTEKDNKFKILSTILALTIATITKPIGFYLSGIVVGMYGLIGLLKYRCNAKENIVKFLKSKELKNIIIITMVVILVFASWTIFKKQNNKYNDFVRGKDMSRVGDSSILYTLKSIATTVFGYYEENHDAADSNNSLIPKIYSLYATLQPISITIYGVIAAIMIASLFIYKYVIKEENKKIFANYIISFTVGLGIYIVFLQLSYILKFNTEEMLGHNGLNRYMPTFLLGMIYFIVAIAIKNMEEKKDRRVNYIILIAIIISFTPLQSIANVTITSGIYNIQSIEYCNNGRIPANKVDNKIEDESKIVIISQKGDTNLYSMMMRYYLYPNHVAKYYHQVNEKQLESIKNKMIEENIEYIYVFSTTEELNGYINNQFENEIQVKSNALYKLETQNEKIQLKEIPLD